MSAVPRTKLIGGVRFTEGEVIPIKGLGFRVVSLTRRGIVLHKPAKQKKTKEEWMNGE